MYCLFVHAPMRVVWYLRRRTAETDPEGLRIDNCPLTLSLLFSFLSPFVALTASAVFSLPLSNPPSQSRTLSLSLSIPTLSSSLSLSFIPSLPPCPSLSLPPSLPPVSLVPLFSLPLPPSDPLSFFRFLPSSLPHLISLSILQQMKKICQAQPSCTIFLALLQDSALFSTTSMKHDLPLQQL